MEKLINEYKINNIKVLNERIFSKNNRNIIESLYELFLSIKESDIDDINKTK